MKHATSVVVSSQLLAQRCILVARIRKRWFSQQFSMYNCCCYVKQNIAIIILLYFFFNFEDRFISASNAFDGNCDEIIFYKRKADCHLKLYIL